MAASLTDWRMSESLLRDCEVEDTEKQDKGRGLSASLPEHSVELTHRPDSPSLGHSQDCAWHSFSLCQSPQRPRALTQGKGFSEASTVSVFHPPSTGSTPANGRREGKSQSVYSLLCFLLPLPGAPPAQNGTLWEGARGSLKVYLPH